MWSWLTSTWVAASAPAGDDWSSCTTSLSFTPGTSLVWLARSIRACAAATVGWPNSDDNGPVSDVSRPRVAVVELAAPMLLEPGLPVPDLFPLEEQADRVTTQASVNPAIHLTVLNVVDLIDPPFRLVQTGKRVEPVAAIASAVPRDNGTQAQQPPDAKSRALWSFGSRGPPCTEPRCR